MTDVGILVSLDEQAVEKSQIVLDYTNRDFVAIRAQLVGLAQGFMPEWEPAGEPSDFGTLILELFAYMGDVMHYYIDRTASEAFLSTAVRRQSVLYIADMLGYRPIGQRSASVALTFTLDENADEDVTIEAGTRIHNQAASNEELIVFELDMTVVLEAREPDAAEAAADPPINPRVKTGYATEGVTVIDKLLGTSFGVPSTELLIPDKGVFFGSVSVITIEGNQRVPWSYVTDLSLGRPTQAIFTIFVDEAEFTHIVFGDNAAGRIPSVDADVYASYRYGVGGAANFLAGGDPDADPPGKGALNTLVPKPDVDLSLVSVNNKESPVGGSDAESIESMKYSIPRAAARIKNRAVTLADYADLAMQVPGVAKSVAFGTVYSLVHVKIAPTDGTADNAQMQRLCLQVEEYMADKILIGSTVAAEPNDTAALWEDIYLQLTVYVAEGFHRTNVREQVETVLGRLVAFDNVDFGTMISQGAVYRAALAVLGVQWVELHWLSTQEPPDGLAATTTNTEPVPLFSGAWKYDISTTIGDPTTGCFRANTAINSPGSNPSIFAFSKTDTNPATGGGGANRGPQLDSLQLGDYFLMNSTVDSSSWTAFIVALDVTDAGNPWIQVNVTQNTQAAVVADLDDEDLVRFQFYRPNLSPEGGQVGDINTGELLIPRFEPTEVVEPEGMLYQEIVLSETERTHDGLWVLAVGGIAST